MISWKRSFEILNEEYEAVKKKKQALDNLANTGRISQSTFDLFNKEIEEAMKEIESKQKTLAEKMNSKIKELEEQIKTLEILLANFEIQHVTGEVDEEVYQREINLLSVGLDAARHELNAVKEAVNKLSGSEQDAATTVAIQQEVKPQFSENIEVSQPEVKIAEEPMSTAEEKLPEPPTETRENCETSAPQVTHEEPQEQLQCVGEPQPQETSTEGEEKQETK